MYEGGWGVVEAKCREVGSEMLILGGWGGVVKRKFEPWPIVTNFGGERLVYAQLIPHG